MSRRRSVASEYRRSLRSGLPMRRVQASADGQISWPPPVDHAVWYQNDPHLFLPGRATAGMYVNEDTALTVSSVFRAVVLLSTSIAQLPLHHYREQQDGSKKRLRDTALSRRLSLEPNAWQTAYEWRELAAMQLLLGGNHYSIIRDGAEGPLSELVPLEPMRVRVEQLETGRLRYRHRKKDGRDELFSQDEVLHLRGPSTDGICGLSPITLARTSIGSAMATEQMAASQFSSAPKLAGVFERTDQFDDDQAKAFAEGFREKHSGPGGWHGTPVLPFGLSFKELGMSNADAQFLESRKFSVNDIARWYGVPPHMLGDLERATFSNIEEEGRNYVTYSLLAWLIRIEHSIRRALIVSDREYVKHVVAGLERGKAESRWKTYAVGLDRGVFSPNDVRRLEDMDPIPGGDRYERAGNIGGGPAPMREPIDEPEDTDDDASHRSRASVLNRLNGVQHA